MRFKQKVRLLLLCITALASFNLWAAVLDDLYQVELTQAEGQSRDEVMRDATIVMLQRLAGSDIALQRGSVAAALKAPQDLMRRIGSADDGKVRIEFEPDALSGVLREAGLSALGRNRPGILVWAVEAGELGDRSMSPVSPWALLLKEAATHRGVALSFPLGDLQDMSQVNEQVIRQASRDELLEASERYPAEGTLVLTIAGQGEQAALDWTLWLNDQSSSGRITGTADAAADELMTRMADVVFAQYSISAAGAEDVSGWQLHVEGINSAADYSSLLRMVRQLGSQQQAKVVAIDGDTVLLQVRFPGNESQLERLLNLDMRLQRIPEPIPEPEPESAPRALEQQTDESSAVAESMDMSDPAPESAAEPAGAGVLPPAEPEQVAPVVPAAPAIPTLYFRWRG
ncbi:DUF2066 domain-containing protein [Pseudomonas sp. FME51]|uniref:DUF2066 domain-containing protein n=1 Tax=Pseudomonas sp. FME51 TaxID=2742609 RepID=UPI0018679543|nr:DUF2066 domain-containing protein [Pseudomonas sp. FME51]